MGYKLYIGISGFTYNNNNNNNNNNDNNNNNNNNNNDNNGICNGIYTTWLFIHSFQIDLELLIY